MARVIDAEKAIEVAQVKYNDWVIAMAAADGRREINLCFKKQELFKAVKAVLACVPNLTPPDHFPDATKMVQGRTNEPLTCTGCIYEPDRPSGIHCQGCARLYADHYRRPPEGEEDT